MVTRFDDIAGIDRSKLEASGRRRTAGSEVVRAEGCASRVSVGELLSLRALFVRTLFVGSFRLRRRLVLARPSRSILPKCSAQKKI